MGREEIEHTTDAEDSGAEGVTRRQALKRLGVGTAIAWSAPVLSSINTPAFAQGNGTPVCAGVDWQCGAEEVECGDTGPFDFCLCTVDVEGNEVCIEDDFCFFLEPCDGNDCPPDHVCVAPPFTCCDDPVCMPVCGNSSTSSRALFFEYPPVRPDVAISFCDVFTDRIASRPSPVNRPAHGAR